MLWLTYQERMVDISKNGVLGNNVINLSELNDVCLLQPLHGVVLARLLIFAQHHPSERACSEGGRKFIIAEVDFSL